MLVNLKSNSIHARLYRWFYNSRLPDNFCPFFWKSLMMFVVIVPFTAICLPWIVVAKLDKDGSSDEMDPGSRMFAGFIMYIALYIAFSMIIAVSSFWIYFEKDSFFYNTSTAGFICIFGVLVLGATALIRFLIEKRREKKAGKIQSHNVLVEFIKAKYNKACPKINWYEE